ncbi:MAG: hypothetical protein AAF202_03875 [Pseudomonadota bacterium]
MKDKYITLLIALLLISFSINALAAGGQKGSKDSLSTNVEFNPMTVHGRYQYAAEATAKVENEKVLFDLLGPRKDFKDRLNKQGKKR